MENKTNFTDNEFLKQVKEVLNYADEVYQQIVIKNNLVIEQIKIQEEKNKEQDEKLNKIFIHLTDLRKHLDNGWRKEFIEETYIKLRDTIIDLEKYRQSSAIEIEKDKKMKKNINWIQLITSLGTTGGVIYLLIERLVNR